MRGTRPRLRHLLGAATLTGSLLFAALTFASLPAGAQTSAALTSASLSCPVLSVGNPNPGDFVLSGAYVISGAAWDPNATSGSGIQSVSVFLGQRDEGGTILGSTQPGIGSNPRAFSVTVTLPDDVNAGTDFSAYALSSVTGQETAVTFPIFVGTQTRNTSGATPTPIGTTQTITTTCPHNAAAAPAAPPPANAPAPAGTPMPAPAVPAGQAAAAPAAGAGVLANTCPLLTVGNPNPGSLIPAGGQVMSGSALVPNGTPGTGILRVDLFLGERDQGGLFLGSAMPGSGSAGPASWSLEVTVPNLGRGLDFAAYAIGNNGQQTVTTFPVFVGAEPTRTGIGATPTPIPTTSNTTTTCGH
jgi:hypothetical protein